MSNSDWKKKAEEADEIRCPECLVMTAIVRPDSFPAGAFPVMVKCDYCDHQITQEEIEAWFSI